MRQYPRPVLSGRNDALSLGREGCLRLSGSPRQNGKEEAIPHYFCPHPVHWVPEGMYLVVARLGISRAWHMTISSTREAAVTPSEADTLAQVR